MIFSFCVVVCNIFPFLQYVLGWMMAFKLSLASVSVLAEVIGSTLLSCLLLYTSLDLGITQSHILQSGYIVKEKKKSLMSLGSRGSTILFNPTQLYRSLFFKLWNWHWTGKSFQNFLVDKLASKGSYKNK